MTTLIPKYDQGSANAVNRPINLKLQEQVSVKDFGAVGDGVTDDTTAIQNALNSSYNVYFPTGTYKVTTTLSIPGSYQNQTLITGSGFGFCQINWAGSTTGTMFTTTTRCSVSVVGICFNNSVALGNTAALAFGPGGWENGFVERCKFVGFNVGIAMGTNTADDSYFNTIQSNLFISCGYGIYMLAANGTLPCNANWVNKNKFQSCGNGIYAVGGCTSNDFSFNDFEGTGITNGIYLNGNDNTIINGHYECGTGNGINIAGGLFNFILNTANNGGSGAFVDNGTSTNVISPRTVNTYLTGVKALQFPTTAVISSNPNTLDDYRKDQTFTPVLNGFTVSGTPTFSVSFTKIGNIVTFTIQIIPSSGGSIAATQGSSYITGLPYTPLIQSTANFVNSSTIQNYGSGLINAFSGGAIYTPSISTTSNTVVVSGIYLT